MPSLKARIAALRAALRGVNTADFFATPLEELDPISQAIVELVHEMEALDTPEKMAAYCEEYDTTPQEVQELISVLRFDRQGRR